MMSWAAILGILSVYLGLLASYHFNVAAGSMIVLVSTLIFFVVFTIQNLRIERARGREVPTP
jgi:manganese/iron transport system permease protein